MNIGDRVKVVNAIGNNTPLNGLTGTIINFGRPFIEVKVDDSLLTEDINNVIGDKSGVLYMLHDELEALTLI